MNGVSLLSWQPTTRTGDSISSKIITRPLLCVRMTTSNSRLSDILVKRRRRISPTLRAQVLTGSDSLFRSGSLTNGAMSLSWTRSHGSERPTLHLMHLHLILLKDMPFLLSNGHGNTVYALTLISILYPDHKTVCELLFRIGSYVLISTSGYNHSGKQGQVNFMSGVMGYANAQRALEYIRVITEFISQPQWKDVVMMFGIMNEAQHSIIGRDGLTSLYVS